MLRRNDLDYFDTFIKLIQYSNSAAKLLNHIVRNFNKETLQKSMEEMYGIVDQMALEEIEIKKKLAKDFITPIEREDILLLLHTINSFTDSIKDVVLHLYMFNLRIVNNDTIRFSELILRSCEELSEIFREFKNFRKSKDIYNKIIRINKVNKELDNFYIESMRKLYLMSQGSTDIVTGTFFYKCFERCSHKCQGLIYVIQEVIVKNT